ncbi:diguanylate cyclase [Halomonas denitrificans]|nr:sensor domain-containing diguanylate cyclase [Halomonas denitrificans]
MRHAAFNCRMVLLAVLLVAAGNAFAQTVVTLPMDGKTLRLQDEALVRVDDGTLRSAADVLAADGFRPLGEFETPPEGRVWLRIPLQANASASGSWVLEVKRRYFRVLELYVPTADGGHATYSNGLADYRPTEILAWHLVYPLELAPGQRAELLIRAETLQGSLGPLDVSVQPVTGYLADRSTAMWAFGLYFGAMFALVFYNLVLYLNLRTPGHRMYVLAMTAVLLFMGMDAGLLQPLLPDGLRERELLVIVVLSCLMMAATIRFFQVFAGAEDRIPKYSRALSAIALVFLALAVVSAFVPLKAAAVFGPASQLLSSVTVFALIGAALLAGRRGSSAAWIFLAAWGAFLGGGFIRSLIGVEAIPRTPIAEYALYVGSVLEAMILALGLSYRVGQLREQRIRAEHEQHRAMTLANQDSLTGAYNRRFFESYLGAMMDDARHSGIEGALLLLDMDHFKQINDTHGHEAGDMMLRSLTRRCLRELRDGDVLCRLGGDEFAIVLRSLSGSAAVEVARRIHRAATERPVDYDGVRIEMAVSIGVLAELEQGLDRSEALRRADRALYRAKDEGRNRVVRHEDE